MSKKWQCNACAETEGGVMPCVITMWLDTITPEMCPVAGEDCDWEIVTEKESPNNEK